MYLIDLIMFLRQIIQQMWENLRAKGNIIQNQYSTSDLKCNFLKKGFSKYLWGYFKIRWVALQPNKILVSF